MDKAQKVLSEMWTKYNNYFQHAVKCGFEEDIDRFNSVLNAIEEIAEKMSVELAVPVDSTEKDVIAGDMSSANP